MIASQYPFLMQSSYAGEEDDHLGASPTSRELLVANEPHSGISALLLGFWQMGGNQDPQLPA